MKGRKFKKKKYLQVLFVIIGTIICYSVLNYQPKFFSNIQLSEISPNWKSVISKFRSEVDGNNWMNNMSLTKKSSCSIPKVVNLTIKYL